MRLPLSSSLSSIADSEDGLLTRHLLLADNNAEYNRAQYCDFDEFSEGSIGSTTPQNPVLRFHPEVSVRFIRARSNTMRSSFSDMSGSYKCSDSPVAPDSKQQLKESSPHSDDEEFDRFYRTMEITEFDFQSSHSRSRRYSLDSVTESPREASAGRPRSVSCDDLFFQSIIASEVSGA